jgi:peptidoglycan L-alanyl-D-glutamate endopeptidase CwlK
MKSTVLQLGDSGEDVVALQQALADHHFSPGDIDGQFGPGTRAAVIAFQNSNVMLADGIAGPRTLFALGLAPDDKLADASAGASIQVVSQMFPSTPVANIRANLPPVLDALVHRSLQDRVMVLVALGTIRAETEGFVPISEGVSQYNTSPNQHPFDLYDYRKDLGNQGPPDGHQFCGRGFVQLTGRANYQKYGPRLSTPADLVANPELANRADVAADLLALFIGDRALSIKDALMHGNFQAARRLVNGGTNGLDRFTEAYQLGDRLLG